MTTIVSRIYADRDHAIAAANELKLNGFVSSAIHLLTPGGAEAASADVTAAIMAYGVPAADAAVYAKGVSEGRSAVTVRAPFGGAYAAMTILDRHAPLSVEVSKSEHYEVMHEPAPLSSVFNMPVLSKTRLPFSEFWSMPTLSHNAAPLSALFNLPMLLSKKTILPQGKLSNNPAPLSSKLGMATLTNRATPLSSALGMMMLTKRR